MNKKVLLNIGIGLLVCLTGCSNTPTAEPEKETAKTEEKSDAKVEESQKEKTPYDVLQEAIKKDQEWTSWSSYTTNSFHRPDFEKMNGGNPVEGSYETYSNNLKTSDAFYQAQEEDYSGYAVYHIQKTTDQESISVSVDRTGNGNEMVGSHFIRNKSSKEKYEDLSSPYSLDGDYFGESDLFDSSQSQDGENTIIKFTLKDGKKFQDYLVTNLHYEAKQELPDGTEIDSCLYSKYEIVFTLDKEGYLQSYQLDMIEKNSEDQESNYNISVKFYKENSTEVDSKVIDEVISQVPETGQYGQLDVTFDYGEIVKP